MSIFPSFGQPTQPDLAQIRRALGETDPAQARSRVEAMLKSGEVSMERFSEVGRQACEIMRSLGIR